MNQSNGISIPGLLGVGFVILKLCHVIGWSWWWVTAPFWGVFMIFAVICVVTVFAMALSEVRRAIRR